MSKGLKKKVSVKLMPGQAIFVTNIEVLQHIAETYIYLSEASETQSRIRACYIISRLH